MYINNGKRFIFLSFLGFLLVYSQTVSAQSNDQWQIFSAASQSEISKTEPEIKSETIVGDSEISGDFQNTFQTTRVSKPNFSKNNNEAAQEKVERFDTFGKSAVKGFAYDFRLNGKRERKIEFTDSTGGKWENPAFDFDLAKADSPADSGDDSSVKKEGFQWRAAIGQSLLFLGVQHGYAILGQAKTRRALKHGAFFRDYVNSVKSLHGWSDGGRFFTNYIAHPMQGSLTGFIYVQNSPQATRQQFGRSGDYWKTRLKAMAWTAAWSTQFEIGPISQASIGNVGEKHKQTWEDIVNTPILGTAMLVTEDALDRYVTQRIERRTDSFYIKIFSRMLLSPTRVFANMLRFKTPWYRDRPMAR